MRLLVIATLLLFYNIKAQSFFGVSYDLQKNVRTFIRIELSGNDSAIINELAVLPYNQSMNCAAYDSIKGLYTLSMHSTLLTLNEDGKIVYSVDDVAFGQMFYNKKLGSIFVDVYLNNDTKQGALATLDVKTGETQVYMQSEPNGGFNGFAGGEGFCWSEEKQVWFTTTIQPGTFSPVLGIWDLTKKTSEFDIQIPSTFDWQYSPTLDSLIVFGVPSIYTMSYTTGKLNVLAENVLVPSSLAVSSIIKEDIYYISSVNILTGQSSIIGVDVTTGKVVYKFMLNTMVLFLYPLQE